MQNHSFPKSIVSCEHAGYLVPEPYSALFTGQENVLRSHLGWDPGALKLAAVISVASDSPLISHIYTRLLIETNRSEGHRSLFSEFTKRLSDSEKEDLVNKYYRPYREEVIRNLESVLISHKSVVHLSVHTFTPVLNGKKRNFEIGLLYDPKRKSEKKFCAMWKQRLRIACPDFIIKMNKPYLGKSDGLTSFLRTNYTDDRYSGIELEVNQAIHDRGEDYWHMISHSIANSFQNVMETISSE
jgi:predicted N-formylglutamate amidohydrolase